MLLGLQEHDIAPLIAAKLLVPLGKPAPNSPKYFATVEILTRAEDCEWLSTATRAIAKHWLRKNNPNALVTRQRKVDCDEQAELIGRNELRHLLLC